MIFLAFFPVTGINYEQITKLLQGSLEYEMNLDHNTCFKTCSDYKYVSHRIQNKYDCKGALHDCTFIDADMNVCDSVNITPNILV